MTAVLVSLSTYVAVINLNNLARLFRGVYQSLAEHLICIMVEDPNPSWKEKGLLFRKFTNEQKWEIKPSNWRLLQYACKIYSYKAGIWSAIRAWTSLLLRAEIQEDHSPPSSSPRDTTYRIPDMSEFRKTFQDAMIAHKKPLLPAQLRLLNGPTIRSSTNDNDDMERGETRASGTGIIQPTSLQLDIELDNLPAQPSIGMLQAEVTPSSQVNAVEDVDDATNQTASPRVSHEVSPHGELKPSGFRPPEASSVSVNQEKEGLRVPSRGEVLEEREENGERFAVV